MQIDFVTTRENDDDCYLWEAKAARGGVNGFGHGYTEASAILKAKQDLELNEKKLSPVSQNWENTPEAFLARVSCLDVCLDFSQFMPVWG